MFWFKKLEVPKNNSTKEIDVIQTWEVRWRSRFNSFSSGTREEVEVFLSHEEALAFKKSLKNAFKLIRHTSGCCVGLRKAK